jgi:tetratricopeptide (TPR) repeat protein
MGEEGRLSSLFGSESDEDASAEAQSASLDPAAAALAMEAARTDTSLAARAGMYFERQARLVAIQTEHLHEQREVQLTNLRLKRLTERLRIAYQLLFGLAALLIVAYLVIMLHDALSSRAVIVEPLDTPPALAADGLSGKVLAGALLDRLTTLQLATQSTAAKRDLANSWSGDIKVELPETGISLGDIDRLLKARFGNDLHIGGDLVRAADGGLALTVRGDGVFPRTFTGAASDLPQLVVQAGEYVYGQTQPALFAVYLLHAGRDAEAIAFSRNAVLTAAADERPYIYNAWAGAITNMGGSLQEALALENAALALKPDYWTAYANATLDARNLGDEEGAWRRGEAMRRAAGGRPGAAPELSYGTWDYLTYNLMAARSAIIADAEHHAGIGSNMGAASPALAALDMDLHDFADAKLRVNTFDETDPYAVAMLHYVRGRTAQAQGDTETALREISAFGTAYANPAIAGGDTSYHCYVAVAASAAAQNALADAELKAGGHYVDCYRARADMLDQRGDWVAAQAVYVAAVAMAPDLPAAYYSWGLALARHGDADGAIGKLREANERGPHWADPLKEWGDVLAAQGNRDGAMSKYDEALRYAPAWEELKQARAK